MARCLVSQSKSYFPEQDIETMQYVRGDLDLYFNPHVEKILIKLEYEESTVFTVEQSCMNVWYPLDSKIDDIEEVNKRLQTE